MTENIISPPNSAQKPNSAQAAGYSKAINKVTSIKIPVANDAITAPFFFFAIACLHIFVPFCLCFYFRMRNADQVHIRYFFEKYFLPNGLLFIIGEIVIRDHGSVTFHYFIIPIIILMLTPPATKNKTDVMIVNAA